MIPTEASDIEHYTPPSLENVVPRPVFRLRAVDERMKKRYNHVLKLEGLRVWSEDQTRAEMLRVLQEQWSPETFARAKELLDNHWAQIDQKLPVDAGDADQVAELTMRCMDVSPLMRRMDADNIRFFEEAPTVALSMFLAGWSHVDAPFRLDAGQIHAESLAALNKALAAIEGEAIAGKVAGVAAGLAWMELLLKATTLLGLTEDEVKNSSAPSLSSETPNGSATAAESRDGASETTISRPAKTPRKSSRKNIATS